MLSPFAQAVRLTRPHNCVIGAASVAVGALLARGVAGWASALGVALPAGLMALLVCAGAYAVNDYYDLGTDAVAKPSRPLVSGGLRPRTALRLGGALWVAAAVPAALGGARVVAFWLGWVAALWLYSWRLKGWGLAGNLVASLAASSGFVLGAAVGGDAGAGVLPALISLALHLGREIAKGVADARGDAAVGLRTLAVRVGQRAALRLALWCIAGVVIVSLIPVVASAYGLGYFVVVALGAYPLLGVSAGRVIGALGRGVTQDDELAAAGRSVARMLKAVMPVGLVAFLLAGV
ncbi:MAG: geranylgeranylglycerol-phosphate geranylgeranyltransferase [bacterium]